MNCPLRSFAAALACIHTSGAHSSELGRLDDFVPFESCFCHVEPQEIDVSPPEELETAGLEVSREGPSALCDDILACNMEAISDDAASADPMLLGDASAMVVPSQGTLTKNQKKKLKKKQKKAGGGDHAAAAQQRTMPRHVLCICCEAECGVTGIMPCMLTKQWPLVLVIAHILSVSLMYVAVIYWRNFGLLISNVFGVSVLIPDVESCAS
eukprot:scaffold435534_cov48-Prasinocladus_malaysianus.AAC.1